MRYRKIRRKLTSMATRAYGAYKVGLSKSTGRGGMWSKLTKHARVKAMKMKWRNPKRGLKRKRYYPRTYK